MTALANGGKVEITQDMMPLTISAPGSYVLVENVTVNDGSVGITIAADHVTLDLAGHVLVGGANSGDGIRITGKHDVEVRDGVITGWGDDGIEAEFTTNCVFRRLQVSDNYSEGIRGGDACAVLACVASRNGIVRQEESIGVGIKVERGSLIKDSVSFDNFEHGIDTASTVEVIDTIVYGNRHDGIHGGQGNIVRGCVAYENAGEGIEVEGGSVVVTCSAMNNLDDGVKTRGEGRTVFARCAIANNGNDGLKSQDGALVLDCTTHENADDGVVVVGECYVRNCTSHGNGFEASGSPGGGVRMEEDENRCHDNHVHGNERGIVADTSASLIVGNSVRDNDTDYFVAGGNLIGTSTGNPAAADPWDNFDL
jgi:hypothetical protein